MEKFKQQKYFQIFTIYLRYLIGGAFVYASIIKIEGGRFTGESGEHVPIDEAWHFFETMYRSGLYWKFLGMSQLVAGGLLMTQKFSKLGALVFFPISINIFVITLSYDFNYTPVITGGLVLANIYLLLWDWNTLKILLGLTPGPVNSGRLENHPIWAYTGLLLFLYTSIYRISVESYNEIIWFSGCIIISVAGFAVYKFRPMGGNFFFK